MSSILSRLLPRFAPFQATVQDGPDQSTPAVAVAPRAVMQADFLFDEEIDNARLLALFRQAFMDVQSIDGGRLRLVGETGIKLLLHADTEMKVIFFSAYFGLKEASSPADKLAFVNRANDRLMFARFSVLNETTLYIDYHLPFAGGIPAAAIVNMARRLPRVMHQAMEEMDRDGVVG